MNVAVIGPGKTATKKDLKRARRIGRLIAAEGWTLLTGGAGGVMEAASTGARNSGGLAIGLLPGNSMDGANASQSAGIPTGLGELRNGLLVRAAAGIICIGGSWGTLSEVAFAIITDKPIIQLGGWRVMNQDGERQPGPIDASTPEEAVAILKSMIHD
jgi:uncharacterized protein (TIGR00725 family)